MDAFVEILLGLTLAGIVVLLVWRRHLYGHEIEMYTIEQGEKRDKRQ